MNLVAKYPKLVLLTLLVLFIGWFYGGILLAPNSYLLSSNGDGIKNYFTYATQINQSEWTSTQAMNYPYGENFLYLDCQPALTVGIKGLSSIFPFIGNYTIGIINWILICSIGISAWFLYLLFHRFGVKPIYAVLGAFSIALLAPQLSRMVGHLALGYSFFIPLTWYAYVRYQESRVKWKWLVFLAMNTFFWFFIHAYLGMILTTFLWALFASEWILDKSKRTRRQLLSFFIYGVVPFLIFWFYAKGTDTHYGRTTNPYGFIESTSNAVSVFLPGYGPVRSWLGANMELKQTWEGMAYIGVGCMVAFIVLLILVVQIRIKNKFKGRITIHEKHLWACILAGVCVLLIAFGYPFKWREGLLNKFEIIKNFRGIGRFSWVFYYTFTVSVFTLLIKYLEWRKETVLNTVLVLFIPLITCLEALPMHQLTAKDLEKTANYFDLDKAPESWKQALKEVKASDYQAIIPLPYYHIGSENFGKEGTDNSYNYSFFLAFHTKLPLMATYATRTSIWEAKSSMQLFAPNFYPKVIRKYIQDKRPFLVVYTKEPLTPLEEDMLRRSRKIAENDQFVLFKLSWEQLFGDSSREVLQKFASVEPDLISEKGMLLAKKDSAKYLFWSSFEDASSNIRHSGKGAWTIPKNTFTSLKSFEAHELKSNTDYVASFWVYNGGPNFGQDVPNGICFYEASSADGNTEWVSIVNMGNAMLIDGDWTLIELPFTTKDAGFTSNLFVRGNEIPGVNWIIDDLLVREAGTDVYRKTPRFLMWNNQRIRLSGLNGGR